MADRAAFIFYVKLSIAKGAGAAIVVYVCVTSMTLRLKSHGFDYRSSRTYTSRRL